ncbi:molybdopterin oxidoreductase family protein [Microcoleus sp.]|uniref:molybdopterin oxidoreductase family protein n=1 Tax=Microcoleus sp. TaxID=44472 RepID=UPI0035242672
METIKTLCPYCGVGCGLEVVPDKNQGWKVRGDRNHPSSQGMVCVKGATVAESIRTDRLLYPMMRDTLDQPFRRASWDEALDAIVNRIQTIRSTTGTDGICVYGSGQFITEDYYVAQKLVKGCLGTNNFDANSRLCMSSAVSGYVQSFGADGPPCCYDDLELTDCAFIIGSNTAECHPIVFNRLAKYHKKNPHVKMIVVDPRRTPTAEAADLHLAIKPGTDIDLLNGIAYLLLQSDSIDPKFIQESTVHFEQFVQVVNTYTPEFVASRCGISVGDLETAAKYWQQSQRVLSLWSMGINQSSEGTAKVRSLINLHLMTGQIGKPGCGPFSLTGQPNAMGGREAGGLSHLLPGYRTVKNAQHRTQVEQLWGLTPGSISPNPGRTAWEMILGLETGQVEMLWIAATNPVVSMPDLERTKAALLRSPFTVYQEAYYPTETSAYAHILLPATQWSEKTGVMTNSERRVSLCIGFDTPLGEARDDWSIFAEVGRRLGFAEQFAFNNSGDVYQEFVQLTRGQPCDVTGLSHEYLHQEGPQQWPCRENEPKHSAKEAKRLYTDARFPTPDQRARFSAYHSRGLAEPPDPNYPFVLTTGRVYGHWHTMTRTGRTDKINQLHPEPFLEIHPRDAANLKIKEGDLLEVRSRRGKGVFPAKVTKAIAPGTLFVPMHWGSLWAQGAEANAMTHAESCPDSKQPELKACAVQLVRVGAEIEAEVGEFNWTQSPIPVSSRSRS